MADFNVQQGATTQKNRIGWGQSMAVQAGIGSGLQQAKLREQREQFNKTYEQSNKQFDIRMGWEKSKFNQEQAMAQKQADYQKKSDAKSERIAMFGTGVEFGKLALSMNQEEEFTLGKGSGPAAGDTAKPSGGGYQVKPSSQLGGEPAVDAQESSMGRGGQTGTGSEAWYSSLGGVGRWAMGTGAGAMTGSMVAQAVFGEGKTQSTVGGAAGGGLGGWYASGGSGYGAAGGAVVGGILGYLLG